MSYKRFHCLRMAVRQTEWLLCLLPFRVATATTTMARSTMRATTATGGVVRRTIVPTHGTATSTTIIQKSTATTTISRTALVSVVSGI